MSKNKWHRENINRVVAIEIKKIRKKHELTQQQFADLIKISQSALARIEKPKGVGVEIPSHALLILLYELDIKPEELLKDTSYYTCLKSGIHA